MNMVDILYNKIYCRNTLTNEAQYIVINVLIQTS